MIGRGHSADKPDMLGHLSHEIGIVIVIEHELVLKWVVPEIGFANYLEYTVRRCCIEDICRGYPVFDCLRLVILFRVVVNGCTHRIITVYNKGFIRIPAGYVDNYILRETHIVVN